MCFVIRRNDVGEFWFRIVEANHETIAHSEIYASKQSAEAAINLVKWEAGAANILDKADASVERPR